MTEPIQYVGAHAEGVVWGCASREDALEALNERFAANENPGALLYRVPLEPGEKPTFDAEGLSPQDPGTVVVQRLDLRAGPAQLKDRDPEPSASSLRNRKPSPPPSSTTEPETDDPAVSRPDAGDGSPDGDAQLEAEAAQPEAGAAETDEDMLGEADTPAPRESGISLDSLF